MNQPLKSPNYHSLGVWGAFLYIFERLQFFKLLDPHCTGIKSLYNTPGSYKCGQWCPDLTPDNADLFCTW